MPENNSNGNGYKEGVNAHNPHWFNEGSPCRGDSHFPPKHRYANIPDGVTDIHTNEVGVAVKPSRSQDR